MIDMFLRGGPVMWPLLLASLVTLTVVFERLFFVIQVFLNRDPAAVEKLLDATAAGDFQSACDIGRKSKGYIAKVLT